MAQHADSPKKKNSLCSDVRVWIIGNLVGASIAQNIVLIGRDHLRAQSLDIIKYLRRKGCSGQQSDNHDEGQKNAQ